MNSPINLRDRAGMRTNVNTDLQQRTLATMAKRRQALTGKQPRIAFECVQGMEDILEDRRGGPRQTG